MAALPSLLRVFLPRRSFCVLGIHISEYYYSLAYLEFDSLNLPGKCQADHVKKRPGGGYSVLAVAQSYALSRFSGISAQNKRSKYIGISLDSALYQIIQLNLPLQIPLHEQNASFRYALEEQGFTPLERWQWDIHSAKSGYDALVCSADWITTALKNIPVTRRAIRYIGPVPELSSCADIPMLRSHMGPWLDQAEIECAVCTALHTAHLVRSVQSITDV